MFCNIEDISIYYEIHGKGRPILNIHGFPLDHRVMKACLEPIFETVDGYQRIYPDLPGMGKTNATESVKNSDDILNIVLQFIDKVIPNQKILLIGESYGGYIVRGIISYKKSLIDGVAFLCPVIYPEQTKRDLPKQLVLERNEDLISSLTEIEGSSFKETAVIEGVGIWNRYREEIYEPSLVGDQSFLTTLYENGYPFKFEVDEKIGVFEKPALFLLGRQDWIVGYRDALNLMEQYPRASIVILDKAGHNLQIEQKDLFESIVLEWLNRTLHFKL